MKKLRILLSLLLVGFFVAAFQFLMMSSSDASSVVTRASQMGNAQSNDTNLATKGLKQYMFIDIKESNLSHFQLNGVNTLTGDSIYLVPTNVHVIAPVNNHELSFVEKFFDKGDVIVNCVLMGLYVAILVLFILLIVSFFRTKVFNLNNVKHIKTVGVLMLVAGVLNGLWIAMKLYVTSLSIQLEGYEVSYGHAFEWGPIVSGLVVLVMCEVLRLATSMKEEQDLTI